MHTDSNRRYFYLKNNNPCAQSINDHVRRHTHTLLLLCFTCRQKDIWKSLATRVCSARSKDMCVCDVEKARLIKIKRLQKLFQFEMY